MAVAWIAAIAAVAGVGLSGYEYANMPGPPGTPNIAGATAAGTRAQAEILPALRAIQAAAQQGTSVSYYDPAHTGPRQFVKVPAFDNTHGGIGEFGSRQETATHSAGPFAFTPGAELFGVGDKQEFKYIPYVAEDWQAGGKYAGLLPKGRNAPGSDAWLKNHVVTRQNANIPGQQRTADFTGFGQADVQGEEARQMAAVMQKLSEKYGVQFAEEARKQLEQSDPSGFAARQKLEELIQKQIDEKPDRPVADLLQKQITDQVHAGADLDPTERAMLASAVRDAQASRGQSGTSDEEFANPITTGMSGKARQLAALQKGESWLTSGATPEDVDYRREETNLSNLSAFINGQTPTAQFRNLSGAQQGTTPFMPGQPLARLPDQGSTASNASQFALGNWQTAMHQASTTANPWMAGLTALLHGVGAANSAGAFH